MHECINKNAKKQNTNSEFEVPVQAAVGARRWSKEEDWLHHHPLSNHSVPVSRVFHRVQKEEVLSPNDEAIAVLTSLIESLGNTTTVIK